MMVALSSWAFFNGGPALLRPLLDGCFVALRGSLDGLLPTPARFAQQSPHVIAVIAHSEGASDHLGHPARGPHIPAKAIRLGSFCSAPSRGFTPVGGCAFRASRPPSRPRLSH